MAKYEKYAEYKDSGVEWLGEIPSHWEVKPLKYVIKAVRGAVKAGPFGSHLKNSDMQDADVKVVTQQNVISNDIHIGDSFISFKKYRELRTFKIFKNDILITTRGTIGRTYVYDTDETAILHPCLIRIQLDEAKANTHFVSLVIQESGYALEQILINSNATTIEVIYSDNLINTIVAIPNSLEEQIKILNYVEYKKSEINTLIEKQQTLIKLLKEKRQAVISHAVTKGLNPDAPIKDSGVEWLGSVPEHWEVTKVGWICEYISYGFTNPMPTSEAGPYMLTATDINFNEVNFQQARTTTESAYKNLISPKSKPKKDDLLLTKDGTLGRVAVFNSDAKTCISQSIALLRPNQNHVLPHFMEAALTSSKYQGKMLFDAGGTTIKHIYISILAKMNLALPSLIEQKIIVKDIYSNCQELDLLIDKAEQAIQLMQERRTALISAAVTGKIDVRGWRVAGVEA